nr:dehydrogenase/reductase 4 [Nephromyces sp. MMRI]
MQESQFDKIMDVNFKASFQLVQDFKEHMNEYGSIVFISSYVGYNPRQPIGMYGVSKTALFGLTRALAYEMWENNHVRVNCVAPGIIKTRFSYVIWGDEEAFKETRRSIIIDRPGQPDEIAAPTAFLCSSDASYITGETLVVGGGLQSHL